MTPRARLGAFTAAALALALAPPGAARAQWLDIDVPPPPALDSAAIAGGRTLYETHCFACHGEEGDGNGPVARYLWPKPRDFTIASFKLRTTASGELPTDEDLFRSITYGLPGSAMPAWGEVLSAEERWGVVAYLKTFAEGLFEDPRFDPALARVEIPPPPRGSPRSLAEAGRAVYERSDCGECHGDAGRGDGPKGGELTDDRGFPDPAPDLESAWKFRGGTTPREIFLRLGTGLDGSPMPSYARSLSDEERWQVAYYVASLALDEARDRSRSVVIPARRVEGALPEGPRDAAWDGAEEVWVPLTGQATFAPRWQIPSTTDLEVRALYNAGEVALRLSWTDRRPDTVPADPALAERAGWTAAGTFPVLFADETTPGGAFEDQAEILFPARPPDGLVLPHFVYGDLRHPVDVWRWSAVPAGRARGDMPSIAKLRARGADAPPEPVPDPTRGLRGRATFESGRWTLVLAAPLGEAAGGPFRSARPGTQIPIAFHVRDGSNGETGLRMALSPWYVLYLEEPAGAWRIGLVLLTVLVAGSLEVAAVRIARGRNAGAASGRF